MAVPLDTLVTARPAISAVFLKKDDELPETIGQHLFIHHALHAICQDAELESPDEQIRGMAMGIWDGLSDRNKIFWAERAATARLVRDREDFLLTDGSTDLANDHQLRTRTAVTEYKRSLTSDAISIADTASIADTELTEEDIDDLEATELDNHSVDQGSTEKPAQISRSAETAVDGSSNVAPAADALQGHSGRVSQSNGTGSDRELRELQRSDADDATLSMETPASSIASLPPGEAESRGRDLAEVLDKKGVATEYYQGVDDGVLEHNGPEICTGAAADIEPGCVDGAAVISIDSSLISKIASVASSVPAWIAQSLDWAEDSQEQADREAAAQPQTTIQEVAREAFATEASSPWPDPVEPPEEPSRVLWIGSLQKKTTVQSLRTTFAEFGRIEFAKVIPYKACGFVNYADVESAIAAKRAMNGQRILNAHDPLLIRFAEDRSRGDPATTKQRDVSSASKQDSSSNMGAADSNDSQPQREHPPVVSGNPVNPTTIRNSANCADDRSVGTATSIEIQSTSNPPSFSTAQLEEAKRFALQATRVGKPPKGKPVTLPVAVQKQARKASGVGTLSKGRNFSGASGASTPTPRALHEDYTPAGTPFAEKVPLAKWEEPVKVRDFGVPTSTEPEPEDEGGKGKNFFLFHALPIVCEDLEIDEPDDYAQSIASAMWLELPAEVKKNWIEDSRSLRGYSVRKPGLVPGQKRFQDSHFTKDYRSQILKALAVRNNGELKYLQPEFKKLMLTERRRRRQEREKGKRQLERFAHKEAEAEETKLIDSATTAQEETAAGDQKSDDANSPLDKAEAKQDPTQTKNVADPAAQDKKPPVEQESLVSEVGDPDPTPPSTTAENLSTAPLSASDPPPPYENDSSAAGSSSESTKSDWQVAGQRSKSSATDTAKRALTKMPWSKVAKAPARG
ncbi:hypothetical protein DOTSEDRAFT_54163 [Dothistroma septosporum NZE10]|uniref:RRM domain-containing protein n=1 Tax=Dothistroma septosporum (strain NZE10 / CBS 128990) TaxID=675120 RepID=M2YMV7_DOTSN|nr:hypothetical protein DOTSEDRAFT_54163 [Dothistroma septosporum NZE10]